MDNTDVTRPRYLIWLAIIVILAAGLRWGNIAQRSMDHDEVVSVFDAKGLAFFIDPHDSQRNIGSYGHLREDLWGNSPVNWSRINAALRNNEINPPLYFYLLAIWMRAFGPSPIAVRLLSTLLGILSVWATVVAATYLTNRRVALVSGALMAILPIHLYYSQNIRPYPVLMLLGAISVYLFARTLNEGKPKWVVLLGLAWGAGMLTHYGFSYLVGTQALYALISRDRVRLTKLIAPALLICAAAVCLWLPGALAQRSSVWDPHVPMKIGLLGVADRFAWVYWGVWLGEGCRWPLIVKMLTALVTLAVLLYAFWAAFRKGRNTDMLAWYGLPSWVFPVVGAAALDARWLSTRYTLALLPGMAIATAWAVLNMPKKTRILLSAFLLPVILAGVARYYLYPLPVTVAMRPVTTFIKQNAPNDALVLTNMGPGLLSYFAEGYPNRFQFPRKCKPDQLAKVTKGRQWVCLFWDTGPRFGGARVRHWMDAHYDRVRETNRGAYAAGVYRPRRTPSTE